MMRANPFHHQNGFTLLELLVALSIFALISVMAYSGLTTVLDARVILEQNMERLGQVQKTVMFLSRDLKHLANRQIRDANSIDGTLPPVLSKNINAGAGELEIELTRSGYHIPVIKAGEYLPGRTHLQRVAYKLEENALYRVTWTTLDRASSTLPHQSLLCDNIDTLVFRYLDDEGNWHEQWPPPNAQQAIVLPKAIEFNLELNDWGPITRLIPLIEVV